MIIYLFAHKLCNLTPEKIAVEEGQMKAKRYDLSAKNPNGKGDIKHKSPEQILKSIEGKGSEIENLFRELKSSLA